MITVLRRTAAISACVLLSGLSVPLAHASGNAVRWRRRRYQAAVHSAAARINGPVSAGNA